MIVGFAVSGFYHFALFITVESVLAKYIKFRKTCDLLINLLLLILLQDNCDYAPVRMSFDWLMHPTRAVGVLSFAFKVVAFKQIYY